MRSIKYIWDVVEWGLCTGCGACVYTCDRDAVILKNFEDIGIRPVFDKNICHYCKDCLHFCPGYHVDVQTVKPTGNENVNHEYLIGQVLSFGEGYAVDDEIRLRGSSGGVLTALALYCLEQENMKFVLHTGMDTKKPLENKTVVSKSRKDLIKHAGSRYTTSSPCDSLRLIEDSDRPCVFIGKPCDVAAVAALRRRRPQLDKNLGLVLSFFCAGTPSSRASLELLRKKGINHNDILKLRYRGNGWPGSFSVTDTTGKEHNLLSYHDSWHFLQKYRSFRCKFCPDGFGELADISCGDAWHKYSKEVKDPGRSLVLSRTEYGRDLVEKAIDDGYITLFPSSSKAVIRAQGLVERRKEIFGRQLAMKFMLIPTTKFSGFRLYKAWINISLKRKFKSIFGTMRRVIQRGLWHRNDLLK